MKLSMLFTHRYWLIFMYFSFICQLFVFLNFSLWLISFDYITKISSYSIKSSEKIVCYPSSISNNFITKITSLSILETNVITTYHCIFLIYWFISIRFSNSWYFYFIYHTLNIWYKTRSLFYLAIDIITYNYIIMIICTRKSKDYSLISF